MIYSLITVSLGASLGALLRFGITSVLGVVFGFSLGTLTVNLLGGYLVGLTVGVFNIIPALGIKWGPLILVGFLGSLTTFSAFSVELCILMQNQRWLLAGLIMVLQVVGSLAMTFSGFWTVNLAQRFF